MGVHLWAFVPIAALVIVAPGPDTVLVTKNAVIHGRSAALATAFGVNAGLLVWTAAAALGLAAVVRESAVGFTALKLVGAAYLVWLGCSALRAMRRASPSEPVSARLPRSSFAAATGFRQGLLSNLGNPKIAVFFTGLLPQFVSTGRSLLEPFLLLGGLFVLMGRLAGRLCADRRAGGGRLQSPAREGGDRRGHGDRAGRARRAPRARAPLICAAWTS